MREMREEDEGSSIRDSGFGSWDLKFDSGFSAYGNIIQWWK
jgi:hypothetical protein